MDGLAALHVPLVSLADEASGLDYLGHAYGLGRELWVAVGHDVPPGSGSRGAGRSLLRRLLPDQLQQGVRPAVQAAGRPGKDRGGEGATVNPMSDAPKRDRMFNSSAVALLQRGLWLGPTQGWHRWFVTNVSTRSRLTSRKSRRAPGSRPAS